MQNEKSKPSTRAELGAGLVPHRNKVSGAGFKNKVYQIVRKIPKGKVLTYKVVTKLAGFPRAWRAVGNILNKNPDPKTIPCHRVIKSDGRIGGFKNGTKKKIALLKREGIKIKKERLAINN